MAKKKIEDFGEEIFGARKHLAQLNRELRATDIGDWTDAEREQNVTKNTAFPKVDYKKEYADGKDREVLYFIKTLRDKLPTQPLYPLKSLYTPEQLPEAKRQAQEDYLMTVSYVYQKAMQLEKPDDFKKFFTEISAAKLPKSNKILKDAKKALDFDGRWGEYTYQRFQNRLEKNKFCFSDKEKMLSNYEIYKYDGKNVKRDENLSKAYHKDYMNVSFGYGKRIFLANNETEANPDNWKQDTYFAIAKGKVDLIAMNVPSREALEEKLVAIEQEKPQTEKAKKAGKKALKPPQLQHIRPTIEDYRQDKPVVEDDFMKDSSTATFPFRGVQFGNWTNQNDRQENLNMSFDAFKDLAKALHIHDEDVTLGGQLAIAYGARGHSGAVAHYEPAENVINLTKMRGAGSLGHEWGHALDNYIAKQIGSHEMYASEGASIDHIYGVDNPMVNLLNTMKYDNSDTGRTQFYRDAKALDGAYSTTGNQKGSNKKGLYWSSEAEMFARAFASYVHDKLGESDYLVGHSEGNYPITKKDGTETTVSISPQGKEKERINDAFDKLFERLKEMEILHDSDKELPKEQTNTAQKNAQEEQIQSSPVPESPAISSASESQKASTEAKQTLQQLVENAMQKAKMIVDAENLKEGDIVRLYGDTAIDSRTMKPTELPPTYAKVDSVSESSISFKTYADEECTKMNGISSFFSTPDEPWTKKLAMQGFDVIQTREQQLAEQMAAEQETSNQKERPVTITCDASTSPIFQEGQTYSPAEFERKLENRDMEKLREYRDNMKKYGSEIEWEKQDIDSYTARDEYIQYTIHSKDGSDNSFKQDIGGGDGGVVAHLQERGNLDLALEVETAIHDEFRQQVSELEKPVTITCNYSVSLGFESGKTYSVSEFDATMKRLDDERSNNRKENLEKYGSRAAWRRQDLKSYITNRGNDKTSFTINLNDGTQETLRQDIGNGDGGVIDFVKSIGRDDLAEILQNAVVAEQQMAQEQEMAQEQAEPAPEVTEPKEDVQNTEQADAQSATNDHSYEYMLLDRLRSDCEYFLGAGETAENNHLWAGNPEAQIEKMQELYDMLPEKPEWLTQEDINQYAQQMIPEKEAEKAEQPSPAVSEQESETNRIANEARLSALEAQKTALDSMMKTLEVSRDVLNPQAITAIEQAIASITADIERLSEPDTEKAVHAEQETQKNAEQPAPERSESVAVDCDIADITRADDGFYEFELSIEAVVEALNRAADVSEDLQNFFVENGVPEKSVIEADEPYMVYGEMNPDIDDGVSMRLQLINPDIDVEIPLYKEECHALSEKIAILDKAEPELPKEDNEKEFVQLEFDFDKE